MPRDLTEVLGRLLTDAALRTELRRDAAAVAARLDVSSEALSGLDLDGLEVQAEELLGKRGHEVEKLLPRTWTGLGSRAPVIFRIHAATVWPEGHHRHLDDALAFASFLEYERYPRCRAEFRRLRFSASRKSWSVGVVPDALVRGVSRRAVQLLYRRNGEVRSLAFTMGL